MREPNIPAADGDTEKPSKTQRKQAAHELTELGRQLSLLKPQQRLSLNLPDDVASALEDACQMRSHGARKRQLQFLGKMLRRHDVAPIRAQLEQMLAPGRHQAALNHQAEHWREQILEQGEPAIDQFVSAHPQADRQQLRQTLRQWRNLPVEHERRGTLQRALYRLLHQQLAADAESAAG
ncbi:MAG: ribosome biogenesis factor YjgA [Wenzhouxiangellaceae bacterium]